MSTTVLQFLLEIILATIIFLHLTRKNFEAALVFGLQSLVIGIIFFNSFLETGNIYLGILVLFIIAVKVILAPRYFIQLIQKHKLTFSVSTHLNIPLTLIGIALLTFVASSSTFAPLTGIFPANQTLLTLALSSIFLSVFLLINRKGALSQIIGVLSLENSIVAFVIFAGLEQSPLLQIGVIFNILIWIVIATVFVSMIYKHFGSLDATMMNKLKD